MANSLFSTKKIKRKFHTPTSFRAQRRLLFQTPAQQPPVPQSTVDAASTLASLGNHTPGSSPPATANPDDVGDAESQRLDPGEAKGSAVDVSIRFHINVLADSAAPELAEAFQLLCGRIRKLSIQPCGDGRLKLIVLHAKNGNAYV